MWRLILFLLIGFAGFWFAKTPQPLEKFPFSTQTEKKFPVIEHKSFVIVLYAHNQELWCERALRSIFEQDYDHYRIIMIDDASVDQTEEKAQQFIVDNNQDSKVILIRNSTPLGLIASLHRAIDNCLNREIIIPLNAKDWLSSPQVLQRLNLCYQNPNIWLIFGQTIEYPSYCILNEGQIAYYAALFKEIPTKDLFAKSKNVSFSTDSPAYLQPILELSAGKIHKLKEPIAFLNVASIIR